MRTYVSISAAVAMTLAVAGCGTAGTYSGKSSYAVYLAQEGASFGSSSGTLDRTGKFSATFKGENFVGQNANNVIEAKGSNGNTLRCQYSMPGEVGTGTCKVSNGTSLAMKFE